MHVVLRGYVTLCIALLFVCMTQVGRAQSLEKILHFDVTLEARTDASMLVTERIQYDFGENERHGIYRDIPESFIDMAGDTHYLSLSQIDVVDDTGTVLPVQISSQEGDRHIRIGDPDITIRGVHTYIITYTAHDVVAFLSDRDELYWNVTGSGWEVPIEQVSATIILPQVFDEREIFTSCYRGSFGSTEKCAVSNTVPLDMQENMMRGDEMPSGRIQTLTFGDKSLASGEGLTVAIGFPKNVITESTWNKLKNLFWMYFSYIDKTIALLVPLTVGFFAWKVWYVRGRDPRGRSTLIPEYTPPGDLSVLESALVLQEKIQPKDVSAGIIELAAKGVLTIEEVKTKVLFFFSKKGYHLKKTGRQVPLSEVQVKLFEALFHAATGGKDGDILISEIKANTFVNDFIKVKQSAGDMVVRKGYFTRNPYGDRSWLLAGVFLFPLLGLLESIFIQFGWIFLGCLIAGAVCGFFEYFINQKTEAGALAKDTLLGLKMYINIAEKDRMEFHNAPEKTPELFEKLLPYAMLLGVTEIWVNEFKDIMQTPPSWYRSTDSSWNMAVFAGHISTFSSAFTTASTPQSSGSSGSGGGGFSGGGGGGGGGGSW